MWLEILLGDVLWGSGMGFFAKYMWVKGCLNDDGGCFENDLVVCVP